MRLKSVFRMSIIIASVPFVIRENYSRLSEKQGVSQGPIYNLFYSVFLQNRQCWLKNLGKYLKNQQWCFLKKRHNECVKGVNDD